MMPSLQSNATPHLAAINSTREYAPENRERW
jgi:hypothetical protein